MIWQGRLVARMDCKAHRKDQLFEIRHLAIELTLAKKDSFLTALAPEIWRFAAFNHCAAVSIERVTVGLVENVALRKALVNMIKDCNPT